MPTIKKINICNEAGVTAPIQTLCQKGAWQKCIGEWCQVCRGHCGQARVGSLEFDTWFAPNFPRLRCSGLCNSAVGNFHYVFYSHIKSISFYFFSTKVQSKQTDRRKRNRCQCSLDTLFPLWMFLLALRNQKWCLTCALNILISSVPSVLPSRQANSVIQFWHRSDIHYLLLSIIKTLLQMSLWALSFVLTLNACLARFSLMSSFLRIFVNETNLWLRVFGHVFQFHVDSC